MSQPTGLSAVDRLAVTTIRTLSIDSVEQANSGHPGLPMGAAPMAFILWSRFLRHQPKNPKWPNRDRFILSAGHGSMLLYSLLHLFGYDVSLDDLRHFRQWGSKTPGHPEYRHTPGVETTTGPLGQGFANAVGMAMAERQLAARFNRPGFPVVDHHTYVLCGDGDLMEGISYEAASLAGHLKLERLIVLYDSNDICLDGPTSNAFTENVAGRFTALGWRVLRVEDGNDMDAIAEALNEARQPDGRPALIEVRTVIGYGSPGKQGTSAAHGSPLGAQEAQLAKTSYGWDADPYSVPTEVYAHIGKFSAAGAETERLWDDLVRAYRATHPELAEQFSRTLADTLPDDWDADLPTYEAGLDVETRKASGAALNALAKRIPALLGGSADLASSNDTTLKGEGVFSPPTYDGRNIWFGVREHAMGAILNGMHLHGGLRVYGGTFLVFSDYLRPAMRLASLMRLPIAYVFTHDSVLLGEDGPTHQPVEHLASLRTIPNLIVMRPADANETVAAWRYALGVADRPIAFALTRQKVPVLAHTKELANQGVSRGGYVLQKETGDRIDAILIATGSEMSLAVQAEAILRAEGLSVRVVSMPATRLFDEQPASYREEVLPPTVKARVAVEFGVTLGWERYVGENGAILGIDHFGASAPASELRRHFHFAPEDVAHVVRELCKRGTQS